MARQYITLPIIKSSNDFGYEVMTDAFWVGGSTGVYTEFTRPQAISNTLTVCYIGNNKARFGVEWDGSLIPQGYDIIKATLYFYITRNPNRTMFYKYTDFSEGASIPSHEPPDGSKSSGTNSGWNAIDIGIPKNDSAVIYVDLKNKYIEIYDDQGKYLGGSFASEIWQAYSHRSPINKPYVIIEYGDTPPDEPTSLYPSGATISTREITRFSWLHNSPAGVSQKSFELQYSLNGGSTWTTVNQTTTNQYYDMPAQTLPESGTVRWRVRTTDFNDETSEYSTATFILGIPEQKAPIPVAPISQYIDEKSKIRFEWIFTGGSASDKQSKADVEYSVNGGNTWITKLLTTDNTYYELEPFTLSKGTVVWRVRTYNNWNEASPYSETKSFVVIGSPATPLITEVSNKARPVVKWQTQEQQIYELEVLKDGEAIYKTGFISNATIREYLVSEYLDNGEYLARLRIVNEFNLYSQWAERRFVVNVIKPDKPSITVYNGSYKVTIKTDSALRSYIYRDGLYLGEVVGGIFEDYTGASEAEYKYFVRCIDENDSFNDSDLKAGKVRLPSNTIATVDNPGDFIKLQYGLDGIPQKDSTNSVDATLQFYDGREFPVTEYSEFSKEEKVLSFHMETRKEVDELRSLIRQRKALIYRDTDGDVIIGSALSVSHVKVLLGYSVGFTITRTV